ncbi:uncharacterized protein [Bos taurus]|uniref:uncharacterized protein isoform X7 n=1 Tax=Bos taurus TaxID=9913 RepID=UPI0028CB6CA9|nr:uncharacterized protein LOC783947 isoform X7 [Bos taurus]
MVVDLPQGWAADEPLRTADQSRKAYEHGKYSGIIILLRDNPTDKAPQEDLVLELPQARAEEPPLRPLEESRAAYEHALQEDLVVKPREAWAKKQPQRTLKCFLLSNHRHMEQPMNTTVFWKVLASVMRKTMQPLQLSAALRHQIRSTEVSGDDEEDWKSKSEHGTWGERLCSESLKTWTWTPSWTPEVVEPPQHQEPHLDQIRGGLIASLLRVLI